MLFRSLPPRGRIQHEDVGAVRGLRDVEEAREVRAGLARRVGDDEHREPVAASAARRDVHERVAVALVARGRAAGQAGVTLSGSGPSVVVWGKPESGSDPVTDLQQRYPDARVLALSIANKGAHVA